MQSYDRRRPNQDPLPDGLEITEQLAYYTNLGRNPRRTASEIPVSKSNVVYIDTRVRAHAVDAKRDEVQARVDKLPKPEQIKIYSELLARLTGEYGNLSDLLPVEQRVSPREWDQYYQKDANNYRQRLIDPGAIPVFGNFGSSSL